MDNEEIIDYWHAANVKVNTFSQESLAAFNLQESTLAFLSNVGLPDEASPYLNFTELKRVDAAYRISSQFAHFIKIGFDGAGNPIVINTNENDLIQWLDHEDNFAPHYVNSSLATLSTCMVLYNQFVKNLIETRGPDAYMDADFTDDQFANLKSALAEADAQAVANAGLWQDEFQTLLANREHYKA